MSPIFSAPALKSLSAVFQSDGGLWMPVNASTTAQNVDFIFWLIMWISVFFFALIVVLMGVFVFQYRRRKGVAPQESPHHHSALELTWTIIPSIIVLIIFYLGFKSYMDMTIAPGNSMEIQVTGQKWQWFFTYPNGYVDENLHVPVNTPVELIMASEDVIHSFFVPAFRVKKDVVPGRYTKLWFEATKTGEYDILCAEYCGTGHSDMYAKVFVHEPGGYETWLADASSFVDRMTPVEAGEKLYNTKGCAQCHTIDGTALIGPTFKELFGETVAFKDGSKADADENYLRESILDPMKNIVAGYDPVMPTYQGKVNDKEIAAIIEFIKSLSEKHRDKVLQAWPDAESGGDDVADEESGDEAAPDPSSGDEHADDENGDSENGGGDAGAGEPINEIGDGGDEHS